MTAVGKSVPQAGRLGNSGANVLEGPGFNNQNISLAKTFRITERFRFTLTAAASAAFNHPNFTAPATDGSAVAGRQPTRDRRNRQRRQFTGPDRLLHLIEQGGTRLDSRRALLAENDVQRAVGQLSVVKTATVA